MKKITLSLISLAMVLFFGLSAYPHVNLDQGIYPKPKAATITYSVDVIVSPETPLCGSYLVMMTDEAGNMVAPAQPFVHGVTTYMFNEVWHDFIGVRTARMVYAPNKEGVCSQQLYAEPDAMFNFFMTGQMYHFDLYPTVQVQHE
jgi:hypothetical protein